MQKIYEQVLSGTYKNHVLPFLWQKGEAKEIIEAYLHKIKESDIHEVCLESRPHPDFCGEQWWSDLSFIIKVCKELDLKIWLLDDSHFPTGYANGWIKEKYPEHRKIVLTHRMFDVIGPQKQVSIGLHNPFDSSELFYGALLIQDNQVRELTYIEKDNRIYFDVERGHAQICILFKSRQSGFRDEYINMVDQASCRVLIDAVYEPHFEHFKEDFGSTILGFFSDEPGFMNEKGINADSLIGKDSMVLPWSDELENRWKKQMKDQHLCALASLWMECEHYANHRHSYMDIATTLYQECFDEQIGEWCREHNVMHIGHVIEDKDSHARLGVGAGHFFRSLSGQDMAGVDIVINQLVPGLDEGFHSYGRGKWDMEFFNYALAKLGSSLANVDPLKKGRCMAEVFGAFGWHEGLKEMKWIADHFLVRGVNYFVPHAFSQAEFPDVDCPPHFYAQGHNPQFRYFSSLMTYMNKMGTLLSDGTPHPTAAILYHADGEWCGDAMPMQKVAKELTRCQIDFTFIPADVFTQSKYTTILKDGKLHINDIVYDCFILPYNEYIGVNVYDFMRKAETMDFPVYVVDDLPAYFYDSKDVPIWSTHPSVVSLSQLTLDMKNHHFFDVTIDGYEPWLRYYHYTKNGEDYHMFVNEHPKKTIRTNVLGLKGKRMDLYRNETFAFEESLILYPYESCLIVEGETDETLFQEALFLKDIKGEWKVSFASSKDYPYFTKEKIIDKLQDVSNTIYPASCGTFRYEIDFNIDAVIKNVSLQIAEAYETVQLFIDDVDYGYLITPSYHFNIKSLTKGVHHLRIEVTNTLDKEIQDMFSLTETSEPSGLLGPVELWVK